MATTKKTTTRKPRKATAGARKPRKATAGARKPRKATTGTRKPRKATTGTRKPCAATKSGEARIRDIKGRCVKTSSVVLRRDNVCLPRKRIVNGKTLMVEYVPNPKYTGQPGVHACIKAGGRAMKSIVGPTKSCDPYTQVWKTYTKDMPKTEYNPATGAFTHLGGFEKKTFGRCILAKGKDKKCHVGENLVKQTNPPAGQKAAFRCAKEGKTPKGYTKVAGGEGTLPERYERHRSTVDKKQVRRGGYTDPLNGYKQKARARTAPKTVKTSAAKATKAAKKATAAAKKATAAAKKLNAQINAISPAPRRSARRGRVAA